MTIWYNDEDDDEDYDEDDDGDGGDDDNDSFIQVLVSPWVVMRMLGTQFGYYVPVMPIGCEMKIIQLREALQWQALWKSWHRQNCIAKSASITIF